MGKASTLVWVLLSAIAAGCGETPQLAEVARPVAAGAESDVRSQTRAAPRLTAPEVVAAGIELRGHEPVLRVGHDDVGAALVERLEAAYRAKSGRRRLVFRADSHEALLRALRERRLDVVVTSLPLTHRDRRRGLVARPLVHVVFGVFVHPDNPITSLRRARLAEIVSGERRDWFALSHRARSIELVALGGDNVWQRVLAQRFFPGRALRDHIVAADVGKALARLRASPAAIAVLPAGTGLIPGLRRVAVDGVVASATSVLTGTYPLALRVELVNRADAALPTQDAVAVWSSSAFRARLADLGVPAR